MNNALKSNNLVETNTYELNKNYSPVITYLVLDPDGEEIGAPFVRFRDMLEEMLQSNIGDELRSEYFENLEGPFSEEALDNYAWDNIERVAIDLGYRIVRIIK